MLKSVSLNEVSNSPAWLIDSSIYVFKAWYTHDDSTDTHGNSINAVLGFLDLAYQLLSIEKPKLIAFAFDQSLQTSYRRDIYPLYKANRAVAPESLKLQFQLCRAFIRAFGIYEQASEYYEADDLIGTWAKSLRNSSISVNLISADKDLAQLVHEGDTWWEYLRGEQYDTHKITKKFKAKPSQIADQLAIAGDKSDNIPGVPGVGMATAGKLLKKYETLDSLLDNIADISNLQIRGAQRIQQLIQEHQDVIRLSRKLTEIFCDVEDVSSDTFRVKALDEKRFFSLAEQLNLSSQQKNKWRKLHQDLL